jgi:hypothetical protein
MPSLPPSALLLGGATSHPQEGEASRGQRPSLCLLCGLLQRCVWAPCFAWVVEAPPQRPSGLKDKRWKPTAMTTKKRSIAGGGHPTRPSHDLRCQARHEITIGRQLALRLPRTRSSCRPAACTVCAGSTSGARLHKRREPHSFSQWGFDVPGLLGPGAFPLPACPPSRRGASTPLRGTLSGGTSTFLKLGHAPKPTPCRALRRLDLPSVTCVRSVGSVTRHGNYSLEEGRNSIIHGCIQGSRC